MYLVKTKTRTLANSSFEAVCNMLSSAVHRRDALGIGSPNQPNQPKTKKRPTFVSRFAVVPPGIEPGTQGFSVLCSTN